MSKIPVVPHFVVESAVVTQLPTAVVWTTRQSAPVLQELRENQEQAVCAVLYLTEGQVECPPETEEEALEHVLHACLEEDPAVQSMKRLNATNYRIVTSTDSAREFQADVWILALTMWKQVGQ